MLLENEPSHINPVAVKVIERIGPRALSKHIRTFADFLVFEFSTSAGGQHVNKVSMLKYSLLLSYSHFYFTFLKLMVHIMKTTLVAQICVLSDASRRLQA